VERKIVRHAVGAAAHEAALDAEFHVGQRVVTIDGIAGRIQFITGSFSPGIAEYQVTLDNGMGGGTYTSSQLRAVPDSYRAPSGPQSHLPAGVTAALEAEAAEIHLASEDYPEMGSILHDRPDPAGQFQVIGSRHVADAYAQGHDERDDDDNGGEADTGIYWESPANQQWRDENLGEPPEPTIEEADDVPGFGQEEFEQGFGKISTTINGQEIDGHGDAPEHGTTPRAANPVTYDAASTEGQGDPAEDKPLKGVDEQAEKSATSGMFPAGVAPGDAFGMSFGAAFGVDQDNWGAWNDFAADKPADPHPDHELAGRWVDLNLLDDRAGLGGGDRLHDLVPQGIITYPRRKHDVERAGLTDVVAKRRKRRWRRGRRRRADQRLYRARQFERARKVFGVGVDSREGGACRGNLQPDLRIL